MAKNYNDVLDRTDAAQIPQHVADEIIVGMSKQSAALALGRQVPTTTRDSRVPVLATAPEAYWVTGDTGLKQTSKAEWDNQTLTAEEMAVVVPVPDAVLEDSEFAIWDALRPLLVRAMSRCLDAAVLFGTGAPASWGTCMVDHAVAAGNTVTASGDPVASLLSAAETVGTDGYAPTAAVVRPGWQYAAARQRADAFVVNPAGAESPYPMTVAGLGIYTDPPYFEQATAEAIVADWTDVLIGVRRDFTLEIFTSGVIQDDTGAIVANLLQQDTSAARATMRVGYLLATPVTDSTATMPSPVGVVTPPTSGSS